MHLRRSDKTGFTLIETIIAVTFLSIIVVVMLGVFTDVFRGIFRNKAMVLATAIGNEKIEEIRNMKYEDVATDANYPPGQILGDQDIVRSNINFHVKIIMKYVDDPYDRTWQSEPADLYPYDYKKVEIRVSWTNHPSVPPAILTTNISPAGPENETDTGSLAVSVIDARGQPVSQAQVRITNPNVTPQVDVTTETDVQGFVLVPLLPPDGNYNVAVSKFGYSSEQTYPINPEMPHPVQPNLSVQLLEVTEITFSIDKLSTLNIKAVDQANMPQTNIDIQISGNKLINTDPDVPKYQQHFVTSAEGEINVTQLEWDSYSLKILNPAGVYISTVSPYQPVSLEPNTELNVEMVLTTSATAPRISSINPLSGANTSSLSISITGQNLSTQTGFKLIKDGQSDIVGTDLTAEASGEDIQLTGTFNLTGALLGDWHVVVTNPNGEYARSKNGFKVVDGIT